jgi:hypothetical protein
MSKDRTQVPSTTPDSTQADEALRRVIAGRTPARTVLERFPAGSPRGSWPAEEYAAARRTEGLPAEVVMDLPSDAFLVVVKGGAR